MTPKPWRGIWEAWWWLCAADILRHLAIIAVTGRPDWFWVVMGALFVATLVGQVLGGRHEASRNVPIEQREYPPLGYRIRRTRADLVAAGRYVGESWRNIGGW